MKKINLVQNAMEMKFWLINAPDLRLMRKDSRGTTEKHESITFPLSLAFTDIAGDDSAAIAFGVSLDASVSDGDASNYSCMRR